MEHYFIFADILPHAIRNSIFLVEWLFETTRQLVSKSFGRAQISAIITLRTNKPFTQLYFGQGSASDFTIHKDEQRRQGYINRHNNSNPNWSKFGIDTADWWGLKYLWSYPTKEEAYNHIKKDMEKMGCDIKYFFKSFIRNYSMKNIILDCYKMPKANDILVDCCVKKHYFTYSRTCWLFWIWKFM